MNRHVATISTRSLLLLRPASTIHFGRIAGFVARSSASQHGFATAAVLGTGSVRSRRRPATVESKAAGRYSLGSRLPWRTITERFAQQRRLHSDEIKPTEDGKVREASTNKTLSTSAAANKTLYSQLPHIPSFHRPTKAELLAAATGRWNRLAIRFKWFSIRSSRPFNSDDISAFISWILWGHVLWIILFTTTFVSLAIYAVNTVFAQETVAGWVGSYLTKSSGVKVVFESAIVPTWRDGTITFRNVFVSRRPGQNGGTRQRAVSKGSSTSAAAAAASAALLAESKPSAGEMQDVHDDGNYTQFDLTIETINVTLSFTKWFNGHGLLNNVEVRGVRGVLDRTFLKPLQQGETAPDPKSYRHTHNTGDFEIDAFKMEDVLLTVYQPREFRPFTVSVFNCELPRLRKQWLFYDFMNANNMSGAFDGSLFTVHPRQLHSTTGALLIEGSESGEKAWKKHSRLRIDGLNIDHLNRGVQGPFSWIYEGNVDLVADVMIPHDEDEGIVKVMKEVYDKVEEKVKEVAEKTLPSTATATPTPLPRTRPRQEDDYVIHNNYDQFSASPLPLPAADPPIDTDTSPPPHPRHPHPPQRRARACPTLHPRPLLHQHGAGPAHRRLHQRISRFHPRQLSGD